MISSAAIAAAATMLQIQLHEYAHAVFAVWETGSATVHGTMETHPELPGTDEAAIAIAGPVFSLTLAVIVYAVSRPLPGGYLRAFLTWMSLSAAQGTFGYLMIAAFVPVGDTAVAFAEWGIPLAGYIVAGLIGLAGMLLNSFLLSREITRFFSDPADVLAASVWTWLLATAILAVVYVSVALISGQEAEMFVAITVGPTTALVFAPMATFFWQKTPHLRRPWRQGTAGVQATVLIVVVAIVLWHAFFPVAIG
ncbi:hypothetical protein [Citricoccus sp. GCM10030269]|uniref:hypothetical protein n=1 Tax=Citricoccus sp. GCM10030269 TaxID=3273388 RepID=UPI003614E54E